VGIEGQDRQICPGICLANGTFDIIKPNVNERDSRLIFSFRKGIGGILGDGFK
jgi:hypothetical protein